MANVKRYGRVVNVNINWKKGFKLAILQMMQNASQHKVNTRHEKGTIMTLTTKVKWRNIQTNKHNTELTKTCDQNSSDFKLEKLILK